MAQCASVTIQTCPEFIVIGNGKGCTKYTVTDRAANTSLTHAGAAGDELGEVTALEELPGGDRGTGEAGGCWEWGHLHRSSPARLQCSVVAARHGTAGLTSHLFVSLLMDELRHVPVCTYSNPSLCHECSADERQAFSPIIGKGLQVAIKTPCHAYSSALVLCKQSTVITMAACLWTAL